MSFLAFCTQTLETIKRKQLKKYHEASEEEKVNIECNPYTIFHQAVNNCKPIIGLEKIKRGGKVYQVNRGGGFMEINPVWKK